MYLIKVPHGEMFKVKCDKEVMSLILVNLPLKYSLPH